MIYSVLYGHLAKSDVKVGDKLKHGSKIGKMGNTGKVIPAPTPERPTAGTHLHLAVVEGRKTTTWTLASMASTNKPSQQQCKYFIENDIFKDDITVITNGWLGYENHYGYDIVGKKGSLDLYWNRSFEGAVTGVGYNSGYGNYVIVTYDTTKKTPVEPVKETVIEIKPVNEIDVLREEISLLEKRKSELEISNDNLKTRIDILTLLNDELTSELQHSFKYICDKDGVYQIKLRKGETLIIK